jgi:hypothetical protein
MTRSGSNFRHRRHGFALWLLSCACSHQSGWGRADPQVAGGQAHNADVDVDVDRELKLARQRWTERSDPQKLLDAIAAWKRVVSHREGTKAIEPDVFVNLTRAHYFYAEAFGGADEAVYREWLAKAVDWGEQAILASDPSFAAKVRAGMDYSKALAFTADRSVPAMYWYSVALAAWVQERGWIVAGRERDYLKATLDRCLELEPDYFYGGPHLWMGVYFSSVPGGLGGDLERARVHFQRAARNSPEYPLTKVLWAEVLAVKLGDRAGFEEMLGEVIESPDDVITEMIPETKLAKRDARLLLQRADELF